MIVKSLFDKDIYSYKIKNKNNAYCEILNYGGIIRSIAVADKNNKLTDLVLGFDTIEDYITTESSYYGAIIGRYANRIQNGSFTLNGRSYQLNKNDGNNHIHGGIYAFNKKIWESKILNDNSIELTSFSPHLEENYPGNLDIKVIYTFDDNNTLIIEYFAKSDEDTIFNPTNHAYFNLGGHNSGHIGESYFKINSSSYTPCNDELIPRGEIKETKNTVFDFSDYKLLKDKFKEIDGFDHNFILKQKHAASCFNPITSIKMDVYTDMPGIQFYTGNFINNKIRGKDNFLYTKHGGFCLETQYYPDSINNPTWPQPILRKGQEFYSRTSYAFSRNL